MNIRRIGWHLWITFSDGRGRIIPRIRIPKRQRLIVAQNEAHYAATGQHHPAIRLEYEVRKLRSDR